MTPNNPLVILVTGTPTSSTIYVQNVVPFLKKSLVMDFNAAGSSPGAFVSEPIEKLRDNMEMFSGEAGATVHCGSNYHVIYATQRVDLDTKLAEKLNQWLPNEDFLFLEAAERACWFLDNLSRVDVVINTRSIVEFCPNRTEEAQRYWKIQAAVIRHKRNNLNLEII